MATVGQGWVSPSEFWQLPPGEIWWLIDAKTAQTPKPKDTEELYQMMMGAIADG
jgi:hypothetical protein